MPSAFVLMMIAGGMLGVTAPPLRGIELGIAFSVLILGAAVAGGGTVPAWNALAAAGFFGFFHGYVHGTEMPAAASPRLYVVGFAVSTAGLHVLGALTGSSCCAASEARPACAAPAWSLRSRARTSSWPG